MPSLVVSHLKTQIFKSFIYLLWYYFVTVFEFRCLANLAEPYLVSGPTYLLQIPNLLHCTQNSVHPLTNAICSKIVDSFHF